MISRQDRLLLHGADETQVPDPGRIEVRVLGPLRVRGADGTVVDGWRTSKNAELLRWLALDALDAGTGLPTERVVRELWPEVDETRGRTSLRTAVSQLRALLGGDVVRRVGDVLVLAHAWVDAVAFSRLAEDVERLRREGRAVEAFHAAREADALHLEDVPVGDGAPGSVAQHAHALALVHRRMLADAAEAAVELWWFADALDLGNRLLGLDVHSERAVRAVMLGHAGCGEQRPALRAFDECRRRLADELGVDPSPQTLAVLQQVLQMRRPRRPPTPLVGRHAQRRQLALALGADGGTASPLVVVRAPQGSGRRRFAAAVSREVGLEVQVVDSSQALATRARRPGQVLVWQPDPDVDGDAVAGLVTDQAGLGPVVLLATDDDAAALPVPPGTPVVELGALTEAEVGQLAETLLAGPAAPSLVAELVGRSDRLPGRAAEIVGAWASSGRLVATSAGLALARADADGDWGRRRLERVLPTLTGDVLDALLLAAVVRDPLTPERLAPLLERPRDRPRARAEQALEQLVDDGLLSTTSAGAGWPDVRLADAVYAWTRPAMRTRLHRRVAASTVVPAQARAAHWLKAGDRGRAVPSAREAAYGLTSRGRHEAAYAQLVEVCPQGPVAHPSSPQEADLLEHLGDAAHALGLDDEARSAWTHALEVAAGHVLPQVVRLRRKLAGLDEAHEAVPGQDCDDSWTPWSTFVTRPAGTGRSVEQDLVAAVAAADAHEDRRAGIETRLALAGAVALPGRDFHRLHLLVEQVGAMQPAPLDLVRSTTLGLVADTLLGHGRRSLDRLAVSVVAADYHGAERLTWQLRGQQLLAAHDVDAVGFEALREQVRARVTAGPADEVAGYLTVLLLRVSVEREELDVADDIVAGLLAGPQHPHLLVQHLGRLARADLAARYEEHEEATDLLRSVVEQGMAQGCTLLVPEAVAKLVVLEAPQDLPGARAVFDVFDDVVGVGVGGPREVFWHRLARAALRHEAGERARSLRACDEATRVASEHGLVLLTGLARGTRSRFLRERRPRTLTVVGREDVG